VSLKPEKKKSRRRAGGSSGNEVANVIAFTKGLKLIGFFINICASLFLINGALFGVGKPSLIDCLTGKKPWRDIWATRFYEFNYTHRNELITSALVIIGSSLQMAADLLDP